MNRTSILSSPATDVWSLGVVLYGMVMNGHFLGNLGDQDLLGILANDGFNVDFGVIYNKHARNACSKLLQRVPGSRCSIKTFMQSSYLGHGKDTVQVDTVFKQDVKLLHNKVDSIKQDTTKILSELNTLRTTIISFNLYDVPRMFVVVPADKNRLWEKVASIGYQKFYLYPLCEHPDCPHFTDDPGYLINEPTEFPKKAGPIISMCCSFLSVGLNLLKGDVGGMVKHAGAVGVKMLDVAQQMRNSVGNVVSPQVRDMLKYGESNDNNFLYYSSYFSSLRNVLDQLKGNKAEYMNESEVREVSDPAFRELQSFLEKNDTERRLGGLTQTPISDGRVLWLCSKHRISALKSWKDLSLESLAAELDLPILLKIKGMTNEQILTMNFEQLRAVCDISEESYLVLKRFKKQTGIS